MGIKNISKTFEFIFNEIELSYKDFHKYNIKSIAIDISIFIYRALKAPFLLTDNNNKIVNHIKSILSMIISLKKNNINMIFVFDNKTLNIIKSNEIKERKIKKNENKKKIQSIIEQNTNNNTNNSDNLFKIDGLDITKEFIEKNKIVKRILSLTDEHINDIIYMLDSFNICYVFTPNNFEAEHICSHFNRIGLVDAVLSSDTDPLAFNCINLIRVKTKNKKKIINLINKKKLLDYYNLTYKEFLKICCLLGNDFCKKNQSRVGCKTILKKFRNMKLTSEQIQAAKYFYQKIKFKLDIINKNNKSFSDSISINNYMNYLIHNHNFNKDKTIKLFKILNNINI